MTDSSNKPLGGDSNKFQGEYIGKVESVDDPKKLLRVQVRVYSIFTDDVPVADLPWAEYRLPVGSRFNDGFFVPVDVGDLVWVKFPYGGDTRRPVIIGSAHYAPGGQPNFPHESWAGPNGFAHKRTGEEPAPAGHAYHKDAVFTQHGATVELREDSSIAIIQRGTGTEIYIHPDGTLVVHGEQDIHFSSKNDTKGVVGANLEIHVNGSTSVVSVGQVSVTAPAVNIIGDLSVSGGIHAGGAIIDGGGNTNHHSH